MAVPSNVMPVAKSTPTPSLWKRPSYSNMSAMKASRAVWLPRSSSVVNCCANAYAGGAAGKEEGAAGGGAAADASRSRGSSDSAISRIISGRVRKVYLYMI